MLHKAELFIFRAVLYHLCNVQTHTSQSQFTIARGLPTFVGCIAARSWEGIRGDDDDDDGTRARVKVRKSSFWDFPPARFAAICVLCA